MLVRVTTLHLAATLVAHALTLLVALSVAATACAGPTLAPAWSSRIPMNHERLASLAHSHWSGTGELWLDPLGNTADTGPCTMRIEPASVRYTWDHKGKTHTGQFTFTRDGARWSDSFHLPAGTDCRAIAGAWGLFPLELTYPAPPGPDWGWRMNLVERPSGELCLQMTNVTPWGEEGRAARMIFTRQE